MPKPKYNKSKIWKYFEIIFRQAFSDILFDQKLKHNTHEITVSFGGSVSFGFDNEMSFKGSIVAANCPAPTTTQQSGIVSASKKEWKALVTNINELGPGMSPVKNSVSTSHDATKKELTISFDFSAD